MYHVAAILVTTYCNRVCPECCYRIPTHAMPAVHYDWAYFERAATFLRGLSVLTISGGEPTLHPQFGRILREFDQLFEPEALELVTNGCDLPRHLTDLGALAHIYLADFPGDVRSSLAVTSLRAWDPARVTVNDGVHVNLARRGAGGPCGRERIAAYAAGSLFPCCVSPGIPGAASMAPAVDWRETLHDVPLACDRCCFSPGDAA